eukprot:12727205-Ditylum_brightwellii.AAC.1
MPGHIPKALDKFQHEAPTFSQHCPHQWNRLIYIKKVHYAKLSNTSPCLDVKGTKRIQSIVGTFLYYSRAIDRPALPALNNIGTQQSAPTQATISDNEWIMDFFHTYLNARLRFFARDMQLYIDLNAAYLVTPTAKSCITGYYFFSTDPNPLNYNNAPHNAPILVECGTLKNIICSAAEAE